MGANMWNRDTAQDEAPRASHTAPPTPVAPITRPVAERRIAWVGQSILFRGDLIGLEDMSIDGRVEGTIELRDHTLTIGPDAQIHADIVARAVTVLGTVVGTITASEAVHIGDTGSVEGNITSRRLAMADGAVVRGRVDTGASRAAESSSSKPQVASAT
jgi:cytoskeletal protein CcmA (bactofilin family)